MTTSVWEQRYASPPLADLERCEENELPAWINSHLPFVGTGVDWDVVGGRHEHVRSDNGDQLRAWAVQQICDRARAGGRVAHCGDSLSPFDVYFAGSQTELVILALLEIPEHHYFLAEDRSWLVVVRMEGDADVVDFAGPP